MKDKYLQDAVDVNDIQYGKLNVITAPCGCGKTTFVEQKLWQEAWWGDLLYLIDSRNGLEAFKLRGEPQEFNGKVYYKHDGITAMTYATFAMLCIYKPEQWLWLDEYALIVCDEMQSCIKWSKIEQENNPINLHKVALQEIHKRISIGARVVAISATTSKIKAEFKDEYVDMPIHGKLKQYKISNKKYYQNIFTLAESLPADKKGIIYVQQIEPMIDLYNALAERDIACATVWSINAKKHTMSEEDLRARESILKYERIPRDIQVLIINAACETGLNIKSDVDYVVVHSTDSDTVTQVIGRVRHDVDTVYYLTKDASNMEIVVPEQYLNKPLSKEDKNALCAELDLRDSRGRIVGWHNVKKKLITDGFKIIDKSGTTGRYSVIST